MKYKENDKVYVPILRTHGVVRCIIDHDYLIELDAGMRLLISETQLGEETNEDWMKNLSTHELAEFNHRKPCSHCYFASDNQECCPGYEDVCIEGQELWLKEVHNQ